MVCLEEERTHALLPCAHLCLCEGCARGQAWPTCPMCRAEAAQVIRIFTA